MTDPHLTDHVKARMAQRGITEEDIRLALRRRNGTPRPGNSGNFWVFGYAGGGRILKVLLNSEQDAVVTAAWPDE